LYDPIAADDDSDKADDKGPGLDILFTDMMDDNEIYQYIGKDPPQ
jgi:hypothetical protein